MLPLEPLLWTLEGLRGVLCDLGCSEKDSAYADDVTTITFMMVNLQMVGETIEGNETVAGARVNRDKSVCLEHGTWGGKMIAPQNVVGRWMVVPVKMLGFWFGPDLQIGKNWVIYLKGRAEIIRVLITSGINYYLIVMPCSHS